MKELVSYCQIKRLRKLADLFADKNIPYDFKLCYSKTDGSLLKVYRPDKEGFLMWRLYDDFDLLVDIIREVEGRNSVKV